MCRLNEEMRNEAADVAEYKTRYENALKMLSDGVLPYEKIAEYSGLTLEEVRGLAGNRTEQIK